MIRKRSLLFLSTQAADLFQKYHFFSDLLHKLLNEGCMVSLEYIPLPPTTKEGSKLTPLEEILIFSGIHHDKIFVDTECLKAFGGKIDKSILEMRPAELFDTETGFDEIFYKCLTE